MSVLLYSWQVGVVGLVFFNEYNHAYIYIYSHEFCLTCTLVLLMNTVMHRYIYTHVHFV